MRGLITRGETRPRHNGRMIGILFLLAISFLCMGQTTPLQVSKDHSFSTHVGDYDALQINPSNIAAHWRTDKRVSFGLVATNFLMYSRGVKQDLFHGGGLDRLTDVSHWVDEVLIERNALNFDNTVLGINVNTKRQGCFAFSVRNNVYMETEINGALEELDFEGADFSAIGDIIMQQMEENGTLGVGDPSYIRLNMVNEFNLGYSRKLYNDKHQKVRVFGGVGVKYLLGFADLGLEFDGQNVAGYYALSSLLPAGWEEENIIEQTKSDKKFGHGFGGSIGGSVKYKQLRAGISVIDLGFMKWPSKSIYITQQDVAVEAITTRDMDEAVNNVLANSQRNENGVELLPAKIIIGGSYDVHKYVSFYTDFVAPVVHTSKGLSNPTIGAGTWLSLKDFITLKTGATLATKRLVTMPLFISFFGGKNKSFEMSLGTSDLVSFFKANREYVNMQTALMKFHF